MHGALALTPLREDLRLHEAAPDSDGAPAWSIQDPVTNRFYRIGWLEFECLLRWPDDPQAIADDIARSTPLAADRELVEQFVQFLQRHHLVRPTSEMVERMAAKAAEPGWRHWRWWLHHYLFVRVPLVRPDRWLAGLLSMLRPLLTRAALVAVLLASLLGLVLTARQWDAFTHGVMDLLTPAGLLGFALAIVVSKTLHELGHALVATHHGVRVAHMGVAFVVLWPMLYTDTSESWRLRLHRQRLAISSAGVAVEMGLAGLSLLAWALLEDGSLRQAMLYLATTAWVLSLALNVSPFMRFDGYFILSDVLGMPNLHERSAAVARAWLRRSLLGWDEPDPEPLTVRQRRAMVAFALTTWLYRALVFLGIAVAVYLMFFKLLGIFLMLVELAWFIARPVWSEVAVWRSRWSEVRTGRRVVLWGLLLALVALLAFPWALDVGAPAVARAERQQAVFSPFAARVAQVRPQGAASKGEYLAQFEAPDLQARGLRTRASIQALQERLAGLPADEQGLGQQQAAVQRLREQLAEAQAIREEAGRLAIAAEFNGLWLDTDPTVYPGTWVGNRQPLGILVDPSRWVVDAYVEQHQLWRIEDGARAVFRVHGQWKSHGAQVIDIDTTRVQRLPHAMLDAQHGGPIATQAKESRGESQAAPTQALYRVRLLLDAPLDSGQEMRGHVSVEGARVSLLWRAVQWTLSVAVRESGF